MLLGNLCAISLFVITPVEGDETTAQTAEYESVLKPMTIGSGKILLIGWANQK